MELTPEWEYVADTVMGGISTGGITRTRIDGRMATRLSGEVSLENHGGFVQMAFDLAGGAVMDASGWCGVELDVLGNGAQYELRLRTDELTKPWQSYRAAFDAQQNWQTVRLPWGDFEKRKTEQPFNPARLRRIGVLAIGAEMSADISVASIRLFG
ncbi:CIA30 family protein [Sulfitobacter sp. F26169L]|uniref:CIA30 family protein n=1 Tax=Sulfitobacter sp. F26169L TaxID=2996015 RepID=UPI002260CBD2|nr:CIA30 family protein [Sulfitobacter sp. F26169L]MCX7567540.1 CIA30 family protein [Sulfitobacter sp. F26169L]